MSDQFKYTTGLRNVGSYLAAGSPYVTASTVSSGTEEEITFPRVTNNITIKTNGTSNSLLISNQGASNPNFSLNFSSSGPAASDGDARTITCWFSSSGTPDPNNNFNIIGTVDSVTDGMCIRENGGKFTSFMKDNNGGSKLTTGIGTFVGGWNFLVLRIQSSGMQMYLNDGTTTNTKTFSSPGISLGTALGTGLKIGPTGNRQMNATLNYRDCILWNSYLSDAQLSDIYNNAKDTNSQWYKNTGIFASTSKLNWMKPTGSVGVIPETLKNHGAGTYSDFVLVGSSSGEVVQISSNSPYLIANELRIHYRSTGSLPNVATNKHYWTLSSLDEEIKMNVKTKEIYLSAVNGDCDYSLHADMTNIPAARMYQHTGSGVDE